MEHTKSIPINNYDDDDHFFDSHDEFLQYEPDDSVSDSSPISQHAPMESTVAAASHSAITSPAVLSSSGFRRRHSFSQHSHGDSKDSNPNSSVTFDISDASCSPASSRLHAERKTRFSRSLTGNVMKSTNSLEAPFRSRGNDDELKEKMETSAVTTASGGKIDESHIVDSHSEVSNEFSWGFLFYSAGMLTKVIIFPFNILFTFLTFPIRTLYFWYMLVTDPFGIMRRAREYLFRAIRDSVARYIYEWMKENNSFWKLGLWFLRASLWSAYISLVLLSLLITALVITGFMMKFLVEKPIQMKEKLIFDYTKSSPVAFVPLISCQAADCGEKCKDNVEIGKLGRKRIIPSNNKFQVTVSLKLPESDYNRNLGIFQVRVDFLSIKGESIGSSSHPSMLQFKSQPIRLILTFFKIVPLLADYFSESQTINVNFDTVKEGKTPTACIKVMVENRAEFRPGAGVPEIYDASLNLESELPLLKRILWTWKKIIFIWISLMVFTTEFLVVLLCFRPLLIPRLRLRNF